MPSQVFVSYSQEDKALYSSLCLALDRSGVLRRDAGILTLGRPLAEELRAVIEDCDICIFLATARSLESRWCLAELGAFWGAGKKVIVYLADPTIDESSLPPQLRGNLWTADAAQLIGGLHEPKSRLVQEIPEGHCVKLGRMTVNVILGRIEECSNEDCLIALPANEYFDDECIHDPKSALGAFMQNHFGDRILEIQALVKAALEDSPTERVEKKPHEMASSFGVGKCVFLDRPLDSRWRVAMVSVTTQRADVGLRAEAAYLFEAAAALQRVLANCRISRLYLPLLCSGHGGLKGEVSLLCMLIAFGELQRRFAHNLREVNIVVFRSSQKERASIPEGFIVRALEFASRFLMEEA